MSFMPRRPMDISGPGGYSRRINPSPMLPSRPTIPNPLPSQPTFGGGLAGLPEAPAGNMTQRPPGFFGGIMNRLKQPQFYQNLSTQLASRFGGPRTQQPPMPMPGPTPMPQMGGGQVNPPPPQMQPPMRRADMWRGMM